MTGDFLDLAGSERRLLGSSREKVTGDFLDLAGSDRRFLDLAGSDRRFFRSSRE